MQEIRASCKRWAKRAQIIRVNEWEFQIYLNNALVEVHLFTQKWNVNDGKNLAVWRRGKRYAGRAVRRFDWCRGNAVSTYSESTSNAQPWSDCPLNVRRCNIHTTWPPQTIDTVLYTLLCIAFRISTHLLLSYRSFRLISHLICLLAWTTQYWGHQENKDQNKNSEHWPHPSALKSVEILRTKLQLQMTNFTN